MKHLLFLTLLIFSCSPMDPYKKAKREGRTYWAALTVYSAIMTTIAASALRHCRKHCPHILYTWRHPLSNPIVHTSIAGSFTAYSGYYAINYAPPRQRPLSITTE